LSQGGVLALVTLPVTIVFGAWLPILVRQVSGANSGHANSGARLYGANSVGAALGSLVAGFVLLPWLGTMQTMIMAVMLLFVCGLYWVPQRKVVWFIVPLLLIVWPMRDLPPVSSLLPQAQADSRDLYRYEDAVSITHVVEQANGQRLLLSDLQRMDASTEPDAVVLQQNQARLPLMLHSDPRSVLFLGLGTGITASGSLIFKELERTAVELSRGAINAAADWFADVNGHVLDSTRVIHHDGRHFLRSSRSQYDVIIGDVFHPDMAGRSALLSVQQFERARNRLSDGGVFVQWLALNQFDVPALQVVLRSFQQVYPDMAVFIDGFRLALVGFKALDHESKAKQLEQPDRFKTHSLRSLLMASASSEAADRASGGEGAWTWLGRYWGQPNPGSGVVQNEWSPQIEFSLPQARYRGEVDIARVMNWLLSQRPTPQQAAFELGIEAAHFGDFERGYMGAELALRSWLARLQGRQAEADRLIRYAYKANPKDRWAGMTLADDMLATLPQALRRGMDKQQALQAIIDVRPDHVEALRALWHLAGQRGDQARAEIYLRQLRRLSPLDREIRNVD
jgi:spermidine synthase